MMDNQEKTKISPGRGRGFYIDTPTKDCICHRPHKIVLCSACGYYMKGRIRKSCIAHPMTLFLMDIERCPRCKAYSFMMQEVENT
ncbi:hypothetical protein L9F63_003355 [Diploptera punctata]|uniref:Uncharacterized protein n=1 Tax=Diploptera punctata TaxID=6984 RepID=A0AAD7ZKB0_DIPPU|nr:hypothetical protein L9F63_003355 [Diploptera punctata]